MLYRPLLALSLVGTLCVAGCQKQAEIQPEPPRPVKTAAVTASAETRAIVLSGSVKARVESALGFRVAGKIIDRKVDIGQRIAQGEILARLDTVDLNLSLRTANAGVDSAKARVRVAQDELSRQHILFNHGYATQAALDRAGLEADQADAALHQAEAARDQAENQTNYGDLIADAKGVVTAVNADIGQVVGAGTPVITVSREDEKEIAINVPEQDIRYFQKDMTVDVSYWAEPNLISKGKVREISGAADPASRTFGVRVSVNNDPRLRLGQTATVTAEIPLADDAPIVPLAALDKRAGRIVVWVVDQASETVASRPVETGAPSKDGVRITKGLAPGEIIVVAGTQFLTDGLKVKVPSSKLASAADMIAVSH